MKTHKVVWTVVAALLALGLAAATWGSWPTLMGFFRAANGGGDRQSDLREGLGEQDHEEDESGADLDMSVEEILAARCEHRLPAHECSECRYEVGVVKVDPSLTKGRAGEQHGLVRTTTVRRTKAEFVRRVTGEVRLNENTAAHINPRISGVIRSVMVDIGDRVETGDVLFEIDSVDVGRALSDYEKSRALVALSRRNLEREKSLFERKIGVQPDVIAAEMEYEKYQTELRAAEQKLHVLGLSHEDIATVGGAGKNVVLGRLPTRAPFAGIVIEKHAVIGELANPDGKVMLVADLSALWVWADIYEHDLQPLLEKKEQDGPIPVEVSVHAFPDRVFKGAIDYVGAVMEERTRTVKVRATVDNSEGLLRPGMFCEVQIVLGSASNVVAIPKVALLSDDGREFVFKHLKDDYYVRREVKSGRELGDSVEVLEGAEPGEMIVADGSFLLKSDVLRSKMGAGCAD